MHSMSYLAPAQIPYLPAYASLEFVLLHRRLAYVANTRIMHMLNLCRFIAAWPS